MKLDLVHDIQSAYRKVLQSMSRPGHIENIGLEADRTDMEAGCLKSTFLLILMLMDTEVSFKVFSDYEEETTRLINRLTYARASGEDNADYILVLKDAGQDSLEKAIQSAKPGLLTDPHRSATLIVETDFIEHGSQLILKGPGIENETGINLGRQNTWVETRAEKNVEYPLGIDMIFIDARHNLLCIPRTTQITRQENG